MWHWAFESKRYSSIHNYPANELGGFTNAITKERIDFLQLKEYATHLSTALVKRYGLKEQETVSLFSQNTVWYPVAMYATLRAGMNTFCLMEARPVLSNAFPCTMPRVLYVAAGPFKEQSRPLL
jgi:4-coumarate--CoA ligase